MLTIVLDQITKKYLSTSNEGTTYLHICMCCIKQQELAYQNCASLSYCLEAFHYYLSVNYLSTSNKVTTYLHVYTYILKAWIKAKDMKEHYLTEISMYTIQFAHPMVF